MKTADGERAVGSWQAGEPAAGLAHYGRRFDDLATEVSLLEARLKAHTGNPAELKSKAQALAESIPTAAAVGDLDGLAARARAMVDTADSAAAESRAEKAAARAAQVARKEALAAEAEQIAAESTAVEGRRRPAEGDRRGVEDDPRDRPQDRRGAVDAVRRGARRLRPPPRGALRLARRAARRGARGQAGADRRGAEALGLHRLGPDERGDALADGPLEGGAADRPRRRRRPVEAVPRRPGRLLHRPRGVRQGPQQRAAGQPAEEGGAARRGGEARPDHGPAGRPERAAQDPGALRRGRPRAARRDALARGPHAGRRAEGPGRGRLDARPHGAGEPDGRLDARRRSPRPRSS